MRCVACQRMRDEQVGHSGLREIGESKIRVGHRNVDVLQYQCEFCDTFWQHWSTGEWLPDV